MGVVLKRIVAFVALALCCAATLEGAVSREERSPTAMLADWKARDFGNARFVGAKVCAECHSTETSTHSTAPMARALFVAGASPIFDEHATLTFKDGAFSYEIRRAGRVVTLTVSGRGSSISEPILYAFGNGRVGQSFVLRRKGVLHEVRVSYYATLRRLDLTVGQEHSTPSTVEQALGRPLAAHEARDCFGCHAPEAVRGKELLDSFEKGVTCEGCHGPGESHVLAMRSKQFEDSKIFNPAKLSSLELTQDYCGACHGGFESTLALPDLGGDNNIRFQAYRLFRSDGHNGTDARIGCIACHDPHTSVRRDAAWYDAKCLACHLPGASNVVSTMKPCPKERANCATCHMPKVELAGMHAKFTDHWIRVVRPGDATPK